MKIINMTPHSVVVTGVNVTFPPSGKVCRVSAVTQKIGDIDGIPLFNTTFGQLEGAPPVEPETMYIVSGLVKDAARRTDFVSPSELVRDANGVVIGCKGLSL